MPFYEYECRVCQARSTKLQAMGSKTTIRCSECQVAQPMKRLVSSAGFRLKGSGWYAPSPTDPTPAPTKEAVK